MAFLESVQDVLQLESNQSGFVGDERFRMFERVSEAASHHFASDHHLVIRQIGGNRSVGKYVDQFDHEVAIGAGCRHP